MKTIPFILIAFLLVSTACSPPPVSTGETEISPPPSAPTLEVVMDVQAGLVEQPPDLYLFVELWRDAHGEGPCPEMMIDFPTYNFHDGVLDASQWAGSAEKNPLPVGFFGEGDSRSGSAGGGAASQLVPISSLPFEVPERDIAIYSADRQGTIISQVGGQNYRIPAGQSWTRITVQTPEKGCQITTTTRLSNYGFVSVSGWQQNNR